MDEELDALEASGATETAKKLRAAWNAQKTAYDTLKAEAHSAETRLKAAQAELAEKTAALGDAGKSVDERVTKLTQERDTFKALAETRATELEQARIRSALGDKLAISDPRTRRRAVDVFLAEYRPDDAGLDAKGQLTGMESAIERFKKEETIFFQDVMPPNGGVRPGSDPRASTRSQSEDPTDSPDYWAQVYGYTKEQA